MPVWTNSLASVEALRHAARPCAVRMSTVGIDGVCLRRTRLGDTASEYHVFYANKHTISCQPPELGELRTLRSRYHARKKNERVDTAIRLTKARVSVATAEQLKSLIKAGLGDDRERFFSSALQVAAHEAGQGHGALAHDIRAIVDQARRTTGAAIIQFPRDMQGLVLAEDPEFGKSVLVMPAEQRRRIDRIVSEYEQLHKLREFGLSNRRKVLLVGPPGTGKTLTAKVLAHEVRLTLYTIQVDRLVTKFMGETTAKLRQVFDLIQEQPGVYLFDEFDAIAGERSMDNDVGEMRRVLNALLQFIEQDRSDSLIVAASNNPDLLDRALFRRFDDVLYYADPVEAERRQLMENVLGHFAPSRLGWKTLLKDSDGLSHADIDRACRDAIKHAVLDDRRKVTTGDVHAMLLDRRRANSGRRA